jgi:hypothetical protein
VGPGGILRSKIPRCAQAIGGDAKRVQRTEAPQSAVFCGTAAKNAPEYGRVPIGIDYHGR